MESVAKLMQLNVLIFFQESSKDLTEKLNKAFDRLLSIITGE